MYYTSVRIIFEFLWYILLMSVLSEVLTFILLYIGPFSPDVRCLVDRPVPSTHRLVCAVNLAAVIHTLIFPYIVVEPLFSMVGFSKLQWI